MPLQTHLRAISLRALPVGFAVSEFLLLGIWRLLISEK
jgi:hypothetical protein